MLELALSNFPILLLLHKLRVLSFARSAVAKAQAAAFDGQRSNHANDANNTARTNWEIYNENQNISRKRLGQLEMLISRNGKKITDTFLYFL